ncbi:glutathione S-transferase family protein [Ottowia thiooxydans]|uniref:glutathione S-transferase family protein n=1 Tax=Ottowia thiooxydans TaxID=219182 RepID=UPI00042968AB|nr:glutathione S-transferase family protein [Ottowia thiooxydans]
MSLILYYHPLSSYCQKVLVALYELGTHFEKRLINLGDSAEGEELKAVWPMGKFPVLRDAYRNQTVPESSIIIEHVDLLYPGPTRLLPTSALDALTVRQWDRVFDLHVQDALQAIVADRIFNKQGDIQAKYDALASAYGVINAQLASGSTWVYGEEFSLADCAAAPALFYASTLQAFGPDDLHLQNYFDRLMTRPSVARVLSEAKPYFQFYPFQERIPQRFL